MAATYDQWVESLKLPVHKGYFNQDLRTTELAWWEKRKCNCAFVQFVGQEGVGEARLIEIPPGKSAAPWKFGLDETYYVLEGRGLATVSGLPELGQKTFEWQKHSLFMVPGQSIRQLSNVQGDRPARLLSYNYFPLAMQASEDPDFFFDNPYQPAPVATAESQEFYSAAKAIWTERGGGRYSWFGNFFPDMREWDRLDPLRSRGAGGRAVGIRFPNSPITAHMSVFPAGTYKKAHRHGPGFFIVIPFGEGYSIMWDEGKENQKVVIPWHEASAFVPPNRWWHQHFNMGKEPARYLALHPPLLIAAVAEAVKGNKDQIEYPDEDPFIRQTFEKELAKRGLKSLMIEEAYKDRDYQWRYD